MENYVEVLVKKKRRAVDMLLRILSVMGAVLFFLLGLQMSVLLLAALVMAALSYYVFLQTDVEYEYLYVDRELRIDKIMAKSRRKKQKEFSLENLEAAATEGSVHLESFRNGKWQTFDYSSQQEGGKRMILYFGKGQKVILEKDEGLLKAMYTASPRKVFLDS